MPPLLKGRAGGAGPAVTLVPLILLFVIFTGGASVAVEPGEVLKDPALEARARTISRQLRCLVCQNQSIDDSDAPLARDLRRLVRDRLRSGDTNEQVIAFVHARYGDFVLLRPPVRPGTWLLWFGPGVLLLVAVLVIWYRLRRRSGQAPERLSGAEQERVDELLGEFAPGAGRRTGKTDP